MFYIFYLFFMHVRFANMLLFFSIDWGIFYFQLVGLIDSDRLVQIFLTLCTRYCAMGCNVIQGDRVEWDGMGYDVCV